MTDRVKTPRKRKCIVTYARAWHALAATRCLGLHGIEVITGDTSSLAAASFSHYSKGHFTYPNPDDDPEGFLSKLEKVARKHQAPDTDLVLMPLHTDTYLIASDLKRFDGLAKLALPTKEQFELAGDKARLSRFCVENNISMPSTLVVDRPEDFIGPASRFTYPALLKLPTSAAAIGMREARSAQEAINFFNKSIKDYDLKPGEYPILQQVVDGEDYCSAFLFDHGEPRAAMTYHNILTYPNKRGMGAVRETVDMPEMEAIGNSILKLLKWHGVAEIDFRWNGSGVPWLIEINPRFWGGLAQSIESGWEFPYLLYKLAVDGRIDPVKPDPHYVRTKNWCLTIPLAIQELMESQDTHTEAGLAYGELKGKFTPRQHHLLSQTLRKLRDTLHPHSRLQAVETVLKDEHGAIDELFKWKDPLPVLGLLYPLSVFIKHGKITPELLVSKAKIE